MRSCHFRPLISGSRSGDESRCRPTNIRRNTNNKAPIDAPPLSRRIRVQMVDRSGLDADVVQQLCKIPIEVRYLDSSHTLSCVSAELVDYIPLVTPGSYCAASDTAVEEMPKSMFSDRPWGPGDSPKAALIELLKSRPEFVIDSSTRHKLQISAAPDGYQWRVS